MAKEQVQKSKSTQKREEVLEEETKKTDTKSAEELLAETDAFFDEIDEALGENLENAFDFVQAFQQKGGQ